MRYFLEIEYKGCSFNGWQLQKNAVSVQQSIQECMSLIFREPVSIYGAGRTDAGVHAVQMFAHTDLNQKFTPTLLKRVNRFLPKDIVIHKAIKVDDNAHARFDAILREYTYRIHLKKSPLLNGLSYHYTYDLCNIDAMKEASDFLKTCKDFTILSRKSPDQTNSICQLFELRWEINSDGNRLIFYISANRFLRGMVRRIVGVLLAIGRGKLSLDEFKHAIITNSPLPVNDKAPAFGLYLNRIEYPYLKNKP